MQQNNYSVSISSSSSAILSVILIANQYQIYIKSMLVVVTSQ